MTETSAQLDEIPEAEGSTLQHSSEDTSTHVDPMDNPITALKELDARAVDGAIPAMCTDITAQQKRVTFEFTTLHDEQFTRTVAVPKTLENSNAESFITEELDYEMQNLDMVEGEWFYVRESGNEWSFYNPPSTTRGRLVQRIRSWYSQRKTQLSDIYANSNLGFTESFALVLFYVFLWPIVVIIAAAENDWPIFWGCVLTAFAELTLTLIHLGLLFW